MGATVLSDRIYRAIADNTPPCFAVGRGMTYSGHPVSASIGLEVLRLSEEGGLLANGQEMGAYFGSKLATLASHPFVGDVRSRGCWPAANSRPTRRPRPAPPPNSVCPAIWPVSGT